MTQMRYLAQLTLVFLNFLALPVPEITTGDANRIIELNQEIACENSRLTSGGF